MSYISYLFSFSLQICSCDGESIFVVQASRADKFETEVRKLRELLGELDFLRSRVDELRAENHLLLEAKQELEDQLASRDRDMTSVVELGKELCCYKELLQRSSEVLYIEKY